MDQVSNSRRYIQTAKSQFVRVEKDIVLRWSEETEAALLSLKPILDYLRGLTIVSCHTWCHLHGKLMCRVFPVAEYTGRTDGETAILDGADGGDEFV
jgi:hypothetical protein